MDENEKNSFAKRIRNGKTLADFTTRMMKLKRRQSRYERPIYAFWELFSDYSEYSTIHGVRYMGEKVNPFCTFTRHTNRFRFQQFIDV